jgi:hypothetical protein
VVEDEVVFCASRDLLAWQQSGSRHDLGRRTGEQRRHAGSQEQEQCCEMLALFYTPYRYTTTPCAVGAPPKMKRDSASVILAVASKEKERILHAARIR